MVLARGRNAFQELCTPEDASRGLLGPSPSREALPSGMHKICRGVGAVTRPWRGSCRRRWWRGKRDEEDVTYTGSEDILVGVVVAGVRCCESVLRRRWTVSGCGVVFVFGFGW